MEKGKKKDGVGKQSDERPYSGVGREFSDDPAVVGCIVDGQEGEDRALVNRVVEWAGANHLLLKVDIRTGLTAEIKTPHIVEEALGGEACFNCQLPQSKNVLQVTWQKMTPEGNKNLASFSELFGPTVNSGFREKVALKDAGLQNCSLVFKDLKEEDAGCYLCLFTIYPSGALTGRTCLQLYELHEPVLRVRESNSTGEAAVVSCSATGRPAPTVTLDVPLRDLGSAQYNTVNNTNGTFTVTVTVSTTAVNGRAVGCAAQVRSGRREVSMTIPEVTRTAGGTSIVVLGVVVAAAACVCFAAGITVLVRKRKISTNRNEVSAMRPAAGQDTPTCKTVLVSQESGGMRQRTNTPKSPDSNRTNFQDGPARKLNFDSGPQQSCPKP